MRKLLAAGIAAMMLAFGTACGPEGGSTDKGKGTPTQQATPSHATSPFDKFWSYQGSKVGIVKPADAEKNHLEASMFFDGESLNTLKSSITPHLVVDQYWSATGPVDLGVSHPVGASKLGEELILTTRVDKPGQDTLYNQFKSALGPNAVDNAAPPTNVEKAFWIHNSQGQPTGVVYHAHNITVSVNFGRPQPKELLEAQMTKIAPYLRTYYSEFYGGASAS